MGKGVFLVWCFAGEFVVDCAFIVDRRQHVARRLKTCHDFEFYFQICCGKALNGAALGIVQEGTEQFFRFVELISGLEPIGMTQVVPPRGTLLCTSG
jgi:hypothetical protein